MFWLAMISVWATTYFGAAQRRRRLRTSPVIAGASVATTQRKVSSAGISSTLFVILLADFDSHLNNSRLSSKKYRGGCKQ
jgi:hypothetical protein